MLRQKRYEHTRTNPEKIETMSRRQPKNANKYCIFANKKPKPNTFVFDLGFDWRERWEFIRTQIFIVGSLFSRLPLHFLYYFLRNSILRIVFGKVISYRYVVVIEYHFSHKRFHYQFPHGHFLYVAAYNRVQILFNAFG